VDTSVLTDRLRRDWWVLVVLAICVLGTVMRGEHETHAAPGVPGGLLASLAVVPLFWRDRRPDVSVLANAAAVTAYFLWSPALPDGPIYLSVFCSTYALASRQPVRAWLPYVGAALVAIVTALLVREARVDSTSALGTAARLIWFTMVDTAAAALAVALRSRRETRAEQTRRVATEEQLRMAQDLHDGVGHGLAVIAMQAGVALHVLDQDPGAARRSLEAIRDTSRESLEALREELVRLSPTSGRPAPRSPRNGLADLDVLADRVRAAGVQVRLDVDAAVVPADVDATAYVVVQEALTNVLRHAGASAAHVTVRLAGDHLEIVITDDGHATASPPDSGPGLGIPGMRARVEALGGTLEAGPLADRGFGVRAAIPLVDTATEGSW
jgi:signal transduction histidine kinase